MLCSALLYRSLQFGSLQAVSMVILCAPFTKKEKKKVEENASTFQHSERMVIIKIEGKTEHLIVEFSKASSWS